MRESKIVPVGSATLTYKNKSFELPAFSGTEGPEVIDIRKLYGEADVFTYDPGFTSTASCESDITFIDGDKGICLYRGYPVDQLAQHGARSDVDVLPRLPPRCAPNGSHVRRRWCAVGVLSRLHRYQRSTPARDRKPSPDRENADHCRHGL